MSTQRDFFLSLAVALILTPVMLLFLDLAGAQVMESGSYRLQSDSINFGGGLSTSSSYTLESTVGEVGSGESSSASYNLKAGYQQMQQVYLALTGAENVTLSPSIPGVTGGVSNGSTTVTVVTDSASGYELTITTASEPALQSDLDTIADYAPAGANPDFTFTTDASDSHFGYSPHGVDTASRFLDNGAACNLGRGNTLGACWDGLSTTTETIALATGGNHPLGATTTIYFRVGVGGSALQTGGTYVATTTITALPL